MIMFIPQEEDAVISKSLSFICSQIKSDTDIKSFLGKIDNSSTEDISLENYSNTCYIFVNLKEIPIHSSIHPSIHTYVYKYIYTYIHTRIRTHIKKN